MDEMNKIINTLGLIDEVIDQKYKNIKEILCLVKPFMELYEDVRKNHLPYHINLIDELRANENAHSRILTKLLQQESSCGKSEILESFVQYIKKIAKMKTDSSEIEKIDIKNPKITHGKKYIDLWIRDEENYAIIIENKIHRLKDEQKQLSRYIKETNKSFSKEQIYVIYLTSTYDNVPDKQTWGKFNNEFEKRFLHLSFREDILKWLTDYATIVKEKDTYLSSALEQYIDHLKGMFGFRNINQKMNMELQKLITKNWKLNGSPREIFNKLITKHKAIKDIDNQIDLMIKDIEMDVFREVVSEWKISLENMYRDYKKIDGNPEVAGVYIQVSETVITRVLLGYDADGEDEPLYCQVDMENLPNKKDRVLPREVVKKVEKLLPDFLDNEKKYKCSQIWKRLGRHAYDEAFHLMLDVIRKLTDKNAIE